MNLCPTCRKLVYRTDACKGVGVECGRTDGGSKKSTGSAEGGARIEKRIEPRSESGIAPDKNYVPENLGSNPSAARKRVLKPRPVDVPPEGADLATQAIDAAKKKGRPISPNPKSKRAEYQRKKMAELRRDHPEKYKLKGKTK